MLNCYTEPGNIDVNAWFIDSTSVWVVFKTVFTCKHKSVEWGSKTTFDILVFKIKNNEVCEMEKLAIYNRSIHQTTEVEK